MTEWTDTPETKYPRWARVQRTDRGDIVNGCHMPTLAKYKVSINSPTSYNFRFTEPFGWANFTINDATGEFSIQSDWGNWSYRWNVDALGKSSTSHEKPLTHFLGTCSGPDYVVDKLGYGEPRDFRERASGEATKRSIRRHILAARIYGVRTDVDADVDSNIKEIIEALTGETLPDYYEDGLSRADARGLWKDVDRWLRDHDLRGEASVMMALDDLPRFPELQEFIPNICGDETWEVIEYEPSFAYVLLCYKLLPFFFDYLRREVL